MKDNKNTVTSQNGFSWILTPQQTNILKQIWKQIAAFPNIKLHTTDRITTQSAEIWFHDLYGEAYISISFNSDKNAIYIDKYYDNEFLQDEYGQVKYVPIQWDNPNTVSQTISNLKSIIDMWLHNKDPKEANNSLNWYKTANLNRQQVVDRIKTWNAYLKNEKDLDVIRTIKETLNTLQEMLTLIDSLSVKSNPQ